VFSYRFLSKRSGLGFHAFVCRSPNCNILTAIPNCNSFNVYLRVGCFSSLEALLANWRGKERGPENENASNLVYFASFGILAGFEICQSIFRIFLDLKLVLEYFFNIKRYKNKKYNLKFFAATVSLAFCPDRTLGLSCSPQSPTLTLSPSAIFSILGSLTRRLLISFPGVSEVV
jgi:hypothetical protein